MQEIIAYALKSLITADGETEDKNDFWRKLKEVKTLEEYVELVDATDLISKRAKEILKEVL